MDVIVDGAGSLVFKDEAFMATQGAPRILDAVVQISDRLRQEGRAILGITVDGQPITPEEVSTLLAGKLVADVAKIEISSESIATLVDASLTDMEAVLPELPLACHRLAEVFQGECPEDGYAPFHQLADVWMVIKTRESQVAGALDVDLNAVEIGGKTFATMHEELNGFLGEAADAILAGDCVLLGDLLEYELAPRAEAETAIVAILRDHARRKAAP